MKTRLIAIAFLLLAGTSHAAYRPGRPITVEPVRPRPVWSLSLFTGLWMLYR